MYLRYSVDLTGWNIWWVICSLKDATIQNFPHEGHILSNILSMQRSAVFSPSLFYLFHLVHNCACLCVWFVIIWGKACLGLKWCSGTTFWKLFSQRTVIMLKGKLVSSSLLSLPKEWKYKWYLVNFELCRHLLLFCFLTLWNNRFWSRVSRQADSCKYSVYSDNLFIQFLLVLQFLRLPLYFHWCSS